MTFTYSCGSNPYLPKAINLDDYQYAQLFMDYFYNLGSVFKFPLEYKPTGVSGVKAGDVLYILVKKPDEIIYDDVDYVQAKKDDPAFSPTPDPTDWDVITKTQASNLGYTTVEDVMNAYRQASMVFTNKLSGDPKTELDAFFYLTAHWLALNKMGSKDSSGSNSGYVSSATIGEESVSFDTSYIDSLPTLLKPYANTSYGRQYLQLTAPIQAVAGYGVIRGYSTNYFDNQYVNYGYGHHHQGSIPWTEIENSAKPIPPAPSPAQKYIEEIQSKANRKRERMAGFKS